MAVGYWLNYYMAASMLPQATRQKTSDYSIGVLSLRLGHCSDSNLKLSLDYWVWVAYHTVRFVPFLLIEGTLVPLRTRRHDFLLTWIKQVLASFRDTRYHILRRIRRKDLLGLGLQLQTHCHASTIPFDMTLKRDMEHTRHHFCGDVYNSEKSLINPPRVQTNAACWICSN